MEVFCKSGKWGGCKKSGKYGVFCIKWTFPQRRVHYVQYQYFSFYILLIWGVRTHPTHPPLPTRPADVYSNQLSYLVHPFRKTTPNSSYSLAADAAAAEV